jgi:hypothetical protein
MPYISQVYKDTNNMKEYLSDETNLLCIEELNKGTIPIVIRWSRRHIKFFVSPDATVEDILTGFSYYAINNMRDIDKVLYVPYNSLNDQYEGGKVLNDYTMSFQSLFQGKNLQILILNRQVDPKNY